MSNASIRPCPFCGKQPSQEVVCSNNHVVVRIRCISDDCDVKVRRTLGIPATFAECERAMNETFALWNRRESNDES